MEIPNRNRKRVNQRENGKQREKNIERGEEREEAKKNERISLKRKTEKMFKLKPGKEKESFWKKYQ